MLRRCLLCIAAIALLNVGAPTFAMSIGNLNVLSNMGEPLRLRIAVSLDDDSAPDIDCFRLVGPSSRAGGVLHNARLEFVSINDRRFVSVSTKTPVEDPIVDLTVRAEGCGPTMQKDFVILLSPPEINATLPTTAPAQVAIPPAPTNTKSQPAASPRPPRGSEAASAKPAHKARSARKQVHRTATPTGTRQFVLKLDYSMASLDHLADQIARRKQMALGSGMPPPAGQALPGTPTSTPQSQGDRLVLQSAGQDAAGVATTAQGGTAAEGINAPQATPEGGASTAASSGGRTGVANGPTSEPPAPSGGSFASLFTTLNLVVLILLLLLAILVAWWFKNRTPRSRFLDQDHDFGTMMPADPENPSKHPLLSKNLPPIDEVFAEPAAAKSLLAETYTPKTRLAGTTPQGEATLPYAPKMGTGIDFTVEQFDSTDHVLELAEVMLAFGRSSQAIETLSQYIRNNANQSIEPWLKLLDLYHDTDSREEFESLAEELHKHFNVVIASWKDFEPLTGKHPEHSGLTLEALPHIMDRLTSTWGTPECLAYLDKLLADNRGGQRQGFSLPLVRDILLLRDIQRHPGTVAS